MSIASKLKELGELAEKIGVDLYIFATESGGIRIDIMRPSPHLTLVRNNEETACRVLNYVTSLTEKELVTTINELKCYALWPTTPVEPGSLVELRDGTRLEVMEYYKVDQQYAVGRAGVYLDKVNPNAFFVVRGPQ